MPAPSNPQLAVLRQWVEKAEHDLTAAAQIQKLGKSAPADTICFHAQQCVEKYLKAALVNQVQAGPAIPLRESRRALAVARRIRREVRRSLPRSAVRRSK